MTSEEHPVTGAGQPDSKTRHALSLPSIVDAALSIIDDEGLAAASMRSVAASLGVQAMSLYHHVPNRDFLLEAVVDRIVQELNDDAAVQDKPTTGWRTYLADLARGVRRYALAHPLAFPVVARRAGQTPWVNPPLRSLHWVESLLSGLQTEGFTDAQALFAYGAFSRFLLGHLMLETSTVTLPGAPEQGTGLAVDAQEYPVVGRLQQNLTTADFDADFESGLLDVLNRIELTVQNGRN